MLYCSKCGQLIISDDFYREKENVLCMKCWINGDEKRSKRGKKKN